MTPVQIEALDYLLDDHYALWDFGDGLPHFRPDANDTKNSELVTLARRGWVSVTYGRWERNDTRPCAAEDAVQALEKVANWAPTDGKPGFVLELSDSGYRLLRSMGIGETKSE